MIVGKMKYGSISAKFYVKRIYYLKMEKGCARNFRHAENLSNCIDHRYEKGIIGQIVDEDSAHFEPLFL